MSGDLTPTTGTPHVDEQVRLLAATGRNFACLAFTLPDGGLANNVMWIDAEDDALLINTEIHRLKYAALLARPEVAVAIWDRTDPYRFGEVRGRVVAEERGIRAREHADRLAIRYTGQPYQREVVSERVILRVQPDRQFGGRL